MIDSKSSEIKIKDDALRKIKGLLHKRITKVDLINAIDKITDEALKSSVREGQIYSNGNGNIRFAIKSVSDGCYNVWWNINEYNSTSFMQKITEDSQTFHMNSKELIAEYPTFEEAINSNEFKKGKAND